MEHLTNEELSEIEDQETTEVYTQPQRRTRRRSSALTEVVAQGRDDLGVALLDAGAQRERDLEALAAAITLQNDKAVEVALSLLAASSAQFAHKLSTALGEIEHESILPDTKDLPMVEEGGNSIDDFFAFLGD